MYEDIVGLDILYKDSSSPSVYKIDYIDKNDTSWTKQYNATGTALFNYLTRSNSMETPEMDDYRKKQHNASIDTLTNQLKQMEADIVIQETAWQNKVHHRDITKDVLRLKLEDILKSLHYEDAPEAQIISEQDLDDLNINYEPNEPVVKMSHEST